MTKNSFVAEVTFNYCDIAFQIYCCNDVFLIKNDQQISINMAKSKVNVLKNARNWAGTKLDILQEDFYIFYIVCSSCCS